jgi:BA14K-like protein
MSQSNRASNGKRPGKTISVLSIAGVSLAASGSASVADVQPHISAPPQNFSFADVEISDVSLATFHLFDEGDFGTPRTTKPGMQVARGGCGCGGGGGGCGGRGCGGGGCGRGCGGWGGCGFGCGGCFFGGLLLGGLLGGCGYGGCGYGYGYGGCGYGDGYGDSGYGVYPNPQGGGVTWCQAHFRSYNPATGTYLGNDGRHHSCP